MDPSIQSPVLSPKLKFSQTINYLQLSFLSPKLPHLNFGVLSYFLPWIIAKKKPSKRSKFLMGSEGAHFRRRGDTILAKIYQSPFYSPSSSQLRFYLVTGLGLSYFWFSFSFFFSFSSSSIFFYNSNLC